MTLEVIVIYKTCLYLLTVVPVLETPTRDDILDQDCVSLHEHRLWHQVDGLSLQLSHLHVHSAELNMAGALLNVHTGKRYCFLYLGVKRIKLKLIDTF